MLPYSNPLYLFRAREQDGSIAKTKYQGLVNESVRHRTASVILITLTITPYPVQPKE
jgi:hypothetical protein